MGPTVVIIVVIVVVAAVWLVMRRRSSGAPGPARAQEIDRPRAPYREFHVAGDAALVYFDVPLPEGEVDPVLSDLLVREAIEVLREKQSHDLPLEDVVVVKVFGIRNGADVEAGSISLETPGILPEIDHVETVPHFSSVPFDPLTHLGEKDHAAPAAAVPAEPVDTGEDGAPSLKPLAEELSLTGRVESGLRAQGLDPAAMGAGDRALGLMRMAGYTVADGGTEDTYVVSSPGSRTYVRIVGHTPGDYPELAEKEMREFQVGFASARADRGMLITEKFGPYIVYDAERRNPKCKFITRERLQDFVDSFSMR